MKIAHITSRITTSTVLKDVLKDDTTNTHTVIYLSEHLSVGPLFDIHKTKGQEKRHVYFKNFYSKLGYTYPDEETFSVADFLNIDFSNFDKIIVWHGTTAQEILLKALCAYQIEESLYSQDVYKWSIENEYPFTLPSQCKPEILTSLLGKESLISNPEREELKQIWQKTIQKEELFRILKDDKIIEVSEDYFDDYILSKAEKGKQRAMKIVGKALGYEYLYLTDDRFVSYRILKLIDYGELKAESKLHPVRELFVSLAN